MSHIVNEYPDSKQIFHAPDENNNNNNNNECIYIAQNKQSSDALKWLEQTAMTNKLDLKKLEMHGRAYRVARAA